MTDYPLFATCPRGLETVLAQELAEQGCANVRTADGGASCTGGLEQIYRANLHSRTASRVLLRLAHGAYRSENDIYRLARSIRWHKWFSDGHTVKVQTEGRRAAVKSLDFVSLKTKDALCDHFRERTGRRPSVDKHRPDIRIRVGEAPPARKPRRRPAAFGRLRRQPALPRPLLRQRHPRHRSCLDRPQPRPRPHAPLRF